MPQIPVPVPEHPCIETVVVQPTPFCNIQCRYCYLPERHDKTVMAHSTIRALFAKVFDSGWTGTDLTVIWHAGEPLVLPIAFYATAFDAIDRLRPASLAIRHSIQTNGMLLTPAWCDFIKARQIGLGVSIDGPQHLHDAQRVTRAGRGTFAKVIAGIRLLRQQQVPFHVISVLSADAMRAPQEMLDFYLSEGIDDICFNVEESEGDHVSTLFATGTARESFRSFLQEFWRLARRSGRVKFIREIDGMLPRVFRSADSAVQNAQVEPFGMLNVDCRGNVSTFSPELLGMRHEQYNNFIIGNINTDSLDAMRASPSMMAMMRDITAGVAACRSSCEYFSVCGGGAPINKLAERGSFRSAQTTFCALTQMVPADLILDAFDVLTGSLDA
jgi:uncharacterized protein